MMNGQNCGRGAASALVAKYTTNNTGKLDTIPRGVATAVAGGISSKIMGGSFENGATTAAYGYLFNALLGRFNKNTGTLRLQDLETGEEMSIAAFSGDRTHRPIPNGWYLIVQHRNENWFRLEPIDEVLGNDMVEGGTASGRREFRLHEGTVSHGCITCIEDSRELMAFIRGTQVTGTLQAMRPDNWMNRNFRSPTEALKVYGVIQVSGNDSK
jgi:hypothetical protein